MTKTIVLTSSKNFRWLSMQEIIPYITDSWKSLKTAEHKVEIIDIDKVNIFKEMHRIIDVDNIVCTCFTVEIIRIVKMLRNKLSIEFKAFFYVHGQASIAMWPFLKWGGEDFLTDNDFLVVSCERDHDCLELAFENPNIINHPFFLLPSYELDNNLEDTRFIYIGRVSEQKNLHSLLLAISLIKEEMRSRKSSLKIIGGTDSLGTPVTGVLPIDYEKKLKNMTLDLEIQDLVEITGHVDRNSFSKILSKQNATFISASLHSDENFGIAPFHYLQAGGSAVLTDWGGYADFSKYFENVSYLQVYLGDMGAYCPVEEIASAMIKDLNKKKESCSKSLNKISDGFMKDLMEYAFRPFKSEWKTVHPKGFALNILKARELFYERNQLEDRNHGSQIFDGFDDKAYKTVASCYGAKERVQGMSNSDLMLSPFVIINKNVIEIQDPHKGNYTFKRLEGNKRVIKDYKNKDIVLSTGDLLKLYKLGYVILLS